MTTLRRPPRGSAGGTCRAARSWPFTSTCQKAQPLQAGAPCTCGADAMDRAGRARPRSTRPVGAHLAPCSAGAGRQTTVAGHEQAALDQRAERHARRLALRRGQRQRSGRRRLAPRRSAAAPARHSRVALDADEAAAEALARRRRSCRCRRTGRARPRPAVVEASSTRWSSASGFCVGCAFWPSRRQPLRAAAEREQPVAAHLQVVVERLHRLVVEGVARLARAWPPRSASRARW